MGSYLLHIEAEYTNQELEHVVKPGKLLDLCCGTGEVSFILKSKTFRTLGLDLNWLALTAFRQSSQEIPLIQGHALHLPLQCESIDSIVAIHCFDLLDRVAFLQECNRVLNFGGILIFDALNRYSYKILLKKLSRIIGSQSIVRQDGKWIDVLSFAEIMQVINHSGFDLLAAHGYSWPPFSANSISRLVSTCVLVEQILRLDRFPIISPRIFMSARKIARIKSDQSTDIAYK